jgi:hypothetical protein
MGNQVAITYFGHSGKSYPVVIPYELNQALMKLTSWEGVWCKTDHNETGYHCNRPNGHDGQHLAVLHNSHIGLDGPAHVLATWK